jgi:hypothetical protein
MISLEKALEPQYEPKPWFPKPGNSYDRNRRQFIFELSLAFIRHFGERNCGLLTLTFPRFVSWKEAQRSLNNAFRRFLPFFFKGYVTIVDLTEAGRIHFHILCATDSDIKTGFNNDVYLRIERLRTRARIENRRLTRTEIKRLNTLGEQITTNVQLKTVQRRLSEKLPQFGFGRVEFIPIRETQEAIANYLANTLIDSINRRPLNLKRPKMWRESKNFPRTLCSAQFRSLTEGSRAWRRKAALVAGVFGETSSSGMQSKFGKSYGYRMMQAITMIDILNPLFWEPHFRHELTRIVHTCFLS